MICPSSKYSVITTCIRLMYRTVNSLMNTLIFTTLHLNVNLTYLQFKLITKQDFKSGFFSRSLMVACQSESELACSVRTSGDLLALHPLAFFLSWASCSKYVVDVRVTRYIPGTLQPSLVRSPTSTPLPVIFHLRTHKERSL